MSNGICPLEWGDRISHRLFGFGTVNGEPRAMVRPDVQRGKTVPAGWMVPVKWDDESREGTGCMNWTLEKVSSPTAKGMHYWSHKWKAQLDALQLSRRSVDSYLETSFRASPAFSERELQARLKVEGEQLAALRAFLRDDMSGLHP